MMRSLWILAAATLLAACGGHESGSATGTAAAPATTSTTASAAAAPAPAVPGAATLSGTVRLEGAAPQRKPLPATPECVDMHGKQPILDEEVVAGPGGELANVLVAILKVPGTFPPPKQAVVLDQKGCQYHPHVVGVQVGQGFDVKNSDETMHNVHGMPMINAQFNDGQPMPMDTPHTFEKEEFPPFKVKCDVHGWMKAWVAVLPNPYFAVSSEKGTFTIPNLPPGSYTVTAWHEKYGTQQQAITVGAGETKPISFTFK